MAEAQERFSRAEYDARIAKTRAAMARAGIELLIVTDPANMSWLTGYDGWSFYVHQCVLLAGEGEPLWYGRAQDANGAKKTVFMDHDRIVGYPDHYVMSTERHPMEHLSALIEARGWSKLAIGVEMENYYFSAACLETLRRCLPNGAFKDATALVNWQRAVKSEQELVYLRRAARIVEEMQARVFELIEPGLPKNQLVAEIYRTAIRGADGHWGDYPSIVPLLPSGSDAAAPHLTWDERPFKAGEGTFFELGGCYRRYNCPLSRTIFLGRPTETFLEAEKAVLEGMEAGLDAAKPGNSCEDIALAFFAVLKKYVIEKDNRTGYPIGLSYPPDWGERTMSLRPGDRTVLEPNMTFHFMTGLWMEDWGFETTESIVITETGVECLTNYPRMLFVKQTEGMAKQGDIEIRDYQPGDQAALLGLVRELQVAEGEVYDRMKPPEAIGDWYLEGLLEACRKRRGRILVAAGEDGPLGYAVVLTEVSSADEPDEIDYSYAYVQDLAVSQPARGRGLGSQLLARCEALARAAGVRWLRVSVLAANAAAVGAYRKAGFAPLSMDMEKPLGPA